MVENRPVHDSHIFWHLYKYEFAMEKEMGSQNASQNESYIYTFFERY